MNKNVIPDVFEEAPEKRKGEADKTVLLVKEQTGFIGEFPASLPMKRAVDTCSCIETKTYILRFLLGGVTLSSSLLPFVEDIVPMDDCFSLPVRSNNCLVV